MGIRFTHQTPTQQVVTCLGFGEQRVNYTVTGNRIDGHSLLHQTKEKLASTLGSTTIESERELVEIVAQMLMTDGPWCVPISQRLSRAITRWTRGINSDAVFFFPLRNVISCS